LARASSTYPTPLATIVAPTGSTVSRVGTADGKVQFNVAANSLLSDIPEEGFFELDPPYWIDGYDNLNYKVLEKESDCTSDQFTVNTQFSSFNGGLYRIYYTGLLSTVPSTGFTIECTNFRNPTY
jgi:hypothetical protein